MDEEFDGGVADSDENMVDVTHYDDLARECKEAARNYEYTQEQFAKASDHAWKICDATFGAGLDADAALLAGIIGYKGKSTDDSAPKGEPESPTAAKKTRAPRKAKETAPVVEQSATAKPAKMPKAGTIKANILAAVATVASTGSPATAKTIADALNLNPKQVGPILCRLVKEGPLRKASGEGYEVAQ